ncbi:MAG: arsenite efflux membrane protein ArsB [Promethearchaeota archaeon CR_4]|nr:MAG: arsenite efflux membrane protein ArsB [Candidatus Lokiarchaeota archaeon CR_4]
MLDIIPIIVFIGVVFLIIRQPRLKIPGTNRHILLDYGYAPLLGIIILLVTLNMPPSLILTGLVGTSQIHPYEILILFFSLAYICISIDQTGFFRYLALLAAKKSGSSGKKLFFYFFALSSILTTFTSNDIVILTITPIILYFTKYTKINPVPYLFGEFFAANIWSIALYVGNPTNIIVAQAYNLTFLGYSQWVLLPTVVAGVTCYFLLYLLFRKDISKPLTPPDINPKSALNDKPGAFFGLIMLGSCLLLLSIAPTFNLNMGLITLIFAIIMLGRDILKDLISHRRDPAIQRFNGTTANLTRMPWKIAPFVICMFVLVQVLEYSGWIDLFASSMSGATNTIGLVATIFFVGFFASLACNVLNNQPMTILFTKMLQNSAFVAPALLVQGSMFALIMGSNFGANFTLIGALAGIMWSNISNGNGNRITYKQFAKVGFKVMPLVVAVACLVLAIEFLIGM